MKLGKGLHRRGRKEESKRARPARSRWFDEIWGASCLSDLTWRTRPSLPIPVLDMIGYERCRLIRTYMTNMREPAGFLFLERSMTESSVRTYKADIKGPVVDALTFNAKVSLRRSAQKQPLRC